MQKSEEQHHLTAPRLYISKYGCMILTMYPLNVVSDDIRDKLIARGIPAEEIAYIHDAKTEQQKAELFDKVRSGEIRILLGSASRTLYEHRKTPILQRSHTPNLISMSSL